MSLVARHLEANGIATVMFGTAKDIVEHCGVARFVFLDFPLGNSCGRSFDADHQHQILELGMQLFENATAPRTTVHASSIWNDDDEWKRLIFTDDQPFLSGEALENWMTAKQRYRDNKAAGQR
ncbi:MAG: D-proline reductase (dithiol) PrdB [Paracrocinitomix sp.]